MLDFLRNLRRSEEERRQEALTAYLDGALKPNERERFEELLASNRAMRSDLERQRQIKEELRDLPRVRAPRNFTLDPAVYGRPVRQPVLSLYPALRTATVLAAIFLVIAVSADLLTGVSFQAGSIAEAPTAQELILERQVESEVALEAEEAAEAESAAMLEEEAFVAPAEEAAPPEPVEEPVAEAATAEDIAPELAAPVAPSQAESQDGFGVEGPQEGTETELRPVPTPRATMVAAEAEADDAASAVAATATDVASRAVGQAVATREGAPTLAPPAATGEFPAGETGTGVSEGLSSTLSALRILELILGVSVVLLAVATLLLRRRR